MDKEILTAIAQVGFPIAMTVYLLTRFQKSLDNLSEKLAELTNELREQKWK